MKRVGGFDEAARARCSDYGLNCWFRISKTPRMCGEEHGVLCPLIYNRARDFEEDDIRLYATVPGGG